MARSYVLEIAFLHEALLRYQRWNWEGASNEMLDDCDEAHLDGLSREGAQNLLHENDATQSAQCGAPKTDDLCIKIIGVSRCTEGVLVKLRTICAKNYFCTFIVVRERDNWAVRGTFIFELALIEQHR
ncbi:hypothetical protein UU5_12563 [Rhodanobacter sp. 115]|nr:hypothetical protein UU5_12563 [Rhodanobacter sp. 115]